jgi:hypothetical protein
MGKTIDSGTGPTAVWVWHRPKQTQIQVRRLMKQWHFSGALPGRTLQRGVAASRRRYDPIPEGRPKKKNAFKKPNKGRFILFFQTFFSLYSLRPCGKESESIMNEIESCASGGDCGTVHSAPQRAQHTFEHPVQVLHLNRASHHLLAIVEVLVWRLHLAVQWHVQNDEFHVGGRHT